MPKRYESLEIVRQKSSMSQKVVTEKDADYARYAGASLADAEKMALLDTLKDCGLSNPILSLYRAFLDQRRKAYLASTSSEITKLGFILGLKDDRTSAADTRTEIDKARQASSDATS